MTTKKELNDKIAGLRVRAETAGKHRQDARQFQERAHAAETRVKELEAELKDLRSQVIRSAKRAEIAEAQVERLKKRDDGGPMITRLTAEVDKLKRELAAK